MTRVLSGNSQLSHVQISSGFQISLAGAIVTLLSVVQFILARNDRAAEVAHLLSR